MALRPQTELEDPDQGPGQVQTSIKHLAQTRSRAWYRNLFLPSEPEWSAEPRRCTETGFLPRSVHRQGSEEEAN